MKFLAVFKGMRRKRIFIEGACYHITARTNRKEMLLSSPHAKNLFVKILSATKERQDFLVDNFVVMNNHFHLMVRLDGCSTVPDIMRWLLGVYAMSWNRQFDSCGRLWGERYFSRPIVSFEDYVRVYRYIDQNPVKADLVQSPGRYRWSGIYHHRSGRKDITVPPPDWLQMVIPGHQYQEIK